ncbi:MAG: hypothetical protein AB1589_44320, partial [Cyanobacteriota bacterium]
LETAQAIQVDHWRAEVLTALADKLPEALPLALNAALAIQDNSWCVHALTALVDKLPEALPLALNAALATLVIRERFFSSPCISELTALADKLTPDLLLQALEASQAIQDDSERARVLTALVNKLPELLPQALEAAQTIQDDSERARVLTALTLHLIHTSNCFNLWKDLLHLLSYRTRSHLLSDIAALIPVIFTLGGETAATEVTQAIQDVAKWWP